MSLPITMPFPPMEAKPADQIPVGEAWQYEPKWDGFRCLAFVDDGDVQLQSKAGKPLGRYFPEMVEHLKKTAGKRVVLDGELIIERDGQIAFDDLLQRIHPAASRVRKLAAETPSRYILFDLLVDPRGTDLTGKPLETRRAKLEQYSQRFEGDEQVALSPASRDPEEAQRWYEQTGGGLDGVVAKKLDEPYVGGKTGVMQKVKNIRTVECVVGGFRYGKSGAVGSLLLGLYDREGKLNHVGFTSSLTKKQRPMVTERLEKLQKQAGKRQEVGFTGSAPGGPSRWRTEGESKWEPLPPELVVEVTYDYFDAGRFRHGTRFIRWRPDKAAADCMDTQIGQTGGSSLVLL